MPNNVDDLAEEIRCHMAQNGNASGSVYARSVLYTLLELGYNIMNKPQSPTNKNR